MACEGSIFKRVGVFVGLFGSGFLQFLLRMPDSSLVDAHSTMFVSYLLCSGDRDFVSTDMDCVISDLRSTISFPLEILFKAKVEFKQQQTARSHVVSETEFDRILNAARLNGIQIDEVCEQYNPDDPIWKKSLIRGEVQGPRKDLTTTIKQNLYDSDFDTCVIITH